MGLLSTIVGAVAGPIAGGLFGSKKETTKQTTDFVALRKSAEAAGFNPLTALKATGGAGFQQTTHPGLSSAEWLAEAIGAGAQAWAKFDPMQQQKDQLELDLMTAEVQRLKASPSYQAFPSPPASRHVLGNEEVVFPERQKFDLYVDVYDSLTKRWVTIPNPDLLDAGPVEIATGLATIGAADAVQNGIPYVAGKVSGAPYRAKARNTPSVPGSFWRPRTGNPRGYSATPRLAHPAGTQ